MEDWDKPIMEKPNILRQVLCGTEDDGSVMMMLLVGDRVVTRSVQPGPLVEQRVQWKEKRFLVLVFSAGGGTEEMGVLVHDVAEREWPEGKSGDCLLTFYVFQPMRARYYS
ncbi:Hypothetical predicted protein [Prunus dulcis]|uniref:Uncharacterized protein n=1 Tax=Prunus dulcis TaxID=3755 RepID=A0A5E4ETP7_PRUDU|nr:Hypothetical predicted protein [Prunus dulcis]